MGARETLRRWLLRNWAFGAPCWKVMRMQRGCSVGGRVVLQPLLELNSMSSSYLNMGIIIQAFLFFLFPSFFSVHFVYIYILCVPKLSHPSSFPLLLRAFSVHLHLTCIKCWSYLTMGIYWSFLILSTSFSFVHFCAHSHLMCIKWLSYLTMGLYQNFLNLLLLSFFLCAFACCVYLHLVSSVQTISP